MLKLEQKALGLVDKYLPVIVIILLSVLGLVSRVALFDFKSGDAVNFLLPWYSQIKEQGISRQVGDYNLFYQFLIFLMTKTPINPLYGYKILSVVFDYLLAFLGFGIIAHIKGKENYWLGITAFGLIIMSPLVVMNSSAWAQCDSMYVFFTVLAVFFLMKERYSLSMVFLGFSFAIKLQTVIVLPLFLAVYFIKRKFSVSRFLIIPATLVVLNIPMFLAGRDISELYSLYEAQTSRWPKTYYNYPTVWAFLDNTNDEISFGYLKTFTIYVALLICMAMIIYWKNSKISIGCENLLYMTFLISFTCVMFLPSMHERYGYLYEILAILIAVIYPKTAGLAVALTGISLMTYGSYLFGEGPISIVIVAIFNVIVYGIYVYVLNKKILKEALISD